MKHRLILFIGSFLVVSVAPAGEMISLAGKWRFALDRKNVGIGARWFDTMLPDKVKLPGSLPAQGIGDDISVDTHWTGSILDRSWFTAPQYANYRQRGNIKIPFWLQPQKYYAGVAWYQRDIEVPVNWEGRRVVLALERPHWETSVWVDSSLVGSNKSLSTPHEYDLGQLKSGKHTLTIRVDNKMIVDIGENSHAITDQTQGNWNGIIGKIELHETPLVWIEDVQVYPDVTTKSITVKGKIGNASGVPGRGWIQLVAAGRTKRLEIAWEPRGGIFETDLELGNRTKTWDEFSPKIYTLRVKLDGHAKKNVTFGIREISTRGTQFTINGRKTFFRGTLECCIFPKTGHPPTDIDVWKRIIGVAKSYGLNLIRFHSYCPPEAAFDAADQLGMYLQVETCWANSSTTLGDGGPVALHFRQDMCITNHQLSPL